MAFPSGNFPGESMTSRLQSLADRAAARGQQREELLRHAQQLHTQMAGSSSNPEEESLAKPTITKRVRFELDSVPVQQPRPLPRMAPPLRLPSPTGDPPMRGPYPPPGLYPQPWECSPLRMHPVTPPPPPTPRPRPHCTHRRVEMDFASPCNLCGEAPQGGFVYACHQDEDDEATMNSRKTRYAYKDIRNPAEELTSIGVNPSIVKSAAEGHYTSEELRFVVAQRLNVIEECKRAEERESLKHTRMVRSPSSPNLLPLRAVDHPRDGFEADDFNGNTMPDQTVTDDDDLYGPRPHANKGKRPVAANYEGHHPPTSTPRHRLPLSEWYVPPGAYPREQNRMRPPPHVPPCDFRACGACRGYMGERMYGSINAVAQDDFHPSSLRDVSRRPGPQPSSTMRTALHVSAGMRERVAEITGEPSSTAESIAASEGRSDYSYESEEGEVVCAESSEVSGLPRISGSVASLAIGFRSASLIDLKPAGSRLRINAGSSPALHSRYRDDDLRDTIQRHDYPPEPIYEMDSQAPCTPITPKGSDTPQPPMPPMPPYDSEEDVVWNRAKPIAHKNYYDNGTYFQGAYHRPFKLSDIPRRAANLIGIRGPISPRAMFDRAKKTRKVTDPKDLPNGTILHSDICSSHATSSQAQSESHPGDNHTSSSSTGRPTGAYTPESFITRSESSPKPQKDITRKRSMSSIASSLKRIVSGPRTKGFEVVRRNSGPTAAGALPPDDHSDPPPGTAK